MIDTTDGSTCRSWTVGGAQSFSTCHPWERSRCAYLTDTRERWSGAWSCVIVSVIALTWAFTKSVIVRDRSVIVERDRDENAFPQVRAITLSGLYDHGPESARHESDHGQRSRR